MTARSVSGIPEVPVACQSPISASPSQRPAAGRVGRFAPTPSGRMHIGNVYAMLGAWLSAHAGDGSESGKVLLRIEDVDEPRSVKDADKWIMDDLHWLGLDWDGEPVYQSQRTEIYEEALQALKSVGVEDVTSADAVSKGSSTSADFPLVYPCFCSRADLRAATAPQEGDRFLIYSGTCRRLLAECPNEVRSRLEEGRRHSWRIAVPEEGSQGSIVTFDDRVFGHQRFDLPLQVGDTVIRRSDGIFSYQLAVVVDDLLMGVNDIVRGRDLLRSSALQVWIRRALIASGFAAEYGIGIDGTIAENGKTRTVRGENAGRGFGDSSDGGAASAVNPAHAHLPLIDDPSGIRLAKRKHSLDIGALRANGVKPEQVIGYCAWLLGVRPPDRVHDLDTSAPIAMSAREALHCFTFDDIRADNSDRILAPNWTDEVDRPENGSVA
ncbi:glutamyl-Q tRNA(Asp) synthetase [Bifidobacterium sp. ESL0763]|nr:glutamyl-Q tRNA(Asp) synthetase [Bifidobacterium sp. ESL0763]MDF7663274.1 glutamyl-Q tRNA(Asp) synthetase [Bifidobacterium sp. ESL0763]